MSIEVLVPLRHYSKACRWFEDHGIEYRVPDDYGFTATFFIEDERDQMMFVMLEDQYYKDFTILKRL